jgi:transketolase
MTQSRKQLDSTQLESFAKNVRRSILKMVTTTKSSHVGSAFSIVEILVFLYNNVFLDNDAGNPKKDNRDRFLLSKGHGCTAVYATLAEMNYFDKNLLDQYAKDGSILMSHINSDVPGVEFSTGSLGHALPVGVGVALSAKNKGENWKTVAVLSDGELNEGSNWEAFMMAAHLELNNLVAIIDKNGIQGLSSTKDVINLNPLSAKFTAFGWDVFEIDGHSYKDLEETFKSISASDSKKPKVIIANTVKGKGISFMENTIAWHYKSPSQEEYEKSLRELE